MTAVVLVVGVLTTLLVQSWAHNRDAHADRHKFTEQAEGTLDSMESVVENYLDDIDDVVTFAGALDPPTPDQFAGFVGTSGSIDPLKSELVLYVEEVEPADLDAVIERETAVRGDEFVPVSTRSGQTQYLLMRSSASGEGFDLPAVDVGMIESVRTALEQSSTRRWLTLADIGAALDRVSRPGGVADRFDLPLQELRTTVEDSGRTPGAGDRAGGVGVVAPVDDGQGRIIGFIVGDLVPRRAFERFATTETGVVALVHDRIGTSVSLIGEPFDDAARIQSRTVSVEGLDFELLVYDDAVAGGSSSTDLLVVIGLGVTLMVGLLAHLWRRWDLQADEMAVQLETTERRANTDPLTGLVNRVGITEALAQMLDERRETRGIVAVLFVDIDRLKVVNDSLGHSVGDEVLIGLGQRFLQVSEGRAVVGRFGGDEFVLLAGGLRDLGAAIAIAQDVLRSLGQPITAGEVELRMDASIGVAFARSTEVVMAGELIRDADAAMYESKRGGGNSYSVFDDRLRVEAVDRLLVEQSLGQAVDLNEIEAWFQPIVDVDKSIIVAMEALVRWRSDSDGVVAPHRFLPIALETGLIVPIGDWMLTEACEVAAILGRHGIDMAVNLSERELADPRCLQRVMTAIDAAGIEPSRLTLEISEDLMVDRLARSIELLRTIRERGVRLSIDDFGTGRSSLSYVKRLDMIAELKIDQSFVAEIASSEADRAIVAAIMAMASSLGMEVVAEGVETAAQLNCLRDLGVGQMQGFYFGRPQPRDMTIQMSRAGATDGRPGC